MNICRCVYSIQWHDWYLLAFRNMVVKHNRYHFSFPTKQLCVIIQEKVQQTTKSCFLETCNLAGWPNIFTCFYHNFWCTECLLSPSKVAGGSILHVYMYISNYNSLYAYNDICIYFQFLLYGGLLCIWGFGMQNIMFCKALMDFDLVFVAKPFAGAIVKCKKACKALVQFDLGSFRCYTLCWCTCEIH